MKKSELREMIREELLKEMALTEMAKIQGDLKTAIKRVISAIFCNLPKNVSNYRI